MKITLYYYSGAGNTKFIAKKVKKHLETNNHNVEMIRITQKTLVIYRIKIKKTRNEKDNIAIISKKPLMIEHILVYHV